MLSFIDQISGAFRTGALPRNLKISGLCCPDCDRYPSNSCNTCERACKCFPLEAVVKFECRGSSVANAHSGRKYGLDTCIPRNKVESIIENRPGGRELLRCDERLLRLLGRGRMYRLESSEGKTLYMVKFNDGDLKEIQRVIEYAEIDVRKLSAEKVSYAIARSFAIGESCSVPPKNQRYLSEESLDSLVNKISLPINKRDFENPSLIEYTQNIGSVLGQGFTVGQGWLGHGEGHTYNWEYEGIEFDCLKIVHRLLENNPTQTTVEAIILPLTKYLRYSDEFEDKYAVEAATSLMQILMKGTEDHRKQMIEAEVIELFSARLSNDCIVKIALLCLDNITCKGTCDDIEKMKNAGAIPRLVDLLESTPSENVKILLQILASAKDHISNEMHTTLLPHVIRLMKNATEQSNDDLLNCLILLRKMLEVNKPPIQAVIDSDVVPVLVINQVVLNNYDITGIISPIMGQSN